MVMIPLPPAPFLPDAAEVLRKATEEGIKLGLALAKKDKEEARAKSELERNRPSESLFLSQGSEAENSTHVAGTTLSSGPYAGLKSARKRVHATVDPEGSSSSFGPAKKSVKKGNGIKNVQTINARTTPHGPEWYESVEPRQNFSRSDLHDLKFLHTLISNAEKDAIDGKDLTQSVSKIRQRIQSMEFFTSLSPFLVKKSGLLEPEGLPSVFENRRQYVSFDPDIRADAEILYRKWMNGHIDPHLYRGIVTKTGTGKEDRGYKYHSLEQDFEGKVSCNYIGAGNLVNGQWWPLQVCAKRDGAHGEIEAGIHGQKGHGAYSIVISGGGYANVDNANFVKYCGTQGSEGSPSAGTKLMLQAYETQHPIRVLRSASLPANNEFRPARGIRYDGLYVITSHEILEEGTAMYRFSLLRLAGQAPIRYSGEGKIPSDAQILEFNKIRERGG